MLDGLAIITPSPTPKVIKCCVFARLGRYIGMSVNNFLAPIHVRLSPNFVSHTHGHRGQGD